MVVSRADLDREVTINTVSRGLGECGIDARGPWHAPPPAAAPSAPMRYPRTWAVVKNAGLLCGLVGLAGG
ncbi:hypothetical protein EKD16_08680 [Streptomonospora litoralis]|uniref:Uncharacterized protein n=1 Tax=Streptomonospora litoralis TaxID=2498135 RepID=A0A4P6Q0D8_9ACTN|nr:hypothetical protein EKD16_08680 [Streptomonospora litoralis]